jgi:hypothetical protein
MIDSKKEKKDLKKEDYLKITCRMYEQKFPNVDDIVMVNKIIKKFSVKFKK